MWNPNAKLPPLISPSPLLGRPSLFHNPFLLSSFVPHFFHFYQLLNMQITNIPHIYPKSIQENQSMVVCPLIGGFIRTIFNRGVGVNWLRSWGVIKINCLWFNAEAVSTKVSKAIFLAMASKNTSNSSITLNGVSKFSPRASKSESVVKLRSPPDKALTSLLWLPSFLASFWMLRSSVLFLWSYWISPDQQYWSIF